KCQPRPQQAQGAGLWNRRLGAATTSDNVVIQRDCAVDRQSAAAADAGAGIQGNAGERENIPFECRRGAESGRAPNLPIDVRVCQTTTENDRGVAGGGQCAA